MKKILLIAILLLKFGVVKAQIGEVKVKNGKAMIYDEEGKYTNNSISLYGKHELNGYNAEYVVITRNEIVEIYDYRGRFTQKKIYLLYGNLYVKNVTNTAILIARKDGSTVYYNFEGKVTKK